MDSQIVETILNDFLDNLEETTKFSIPQRMHNHNGWNYIDNKIFHLSVKNNIPILILKGGKNEIKLNLSNYDYINHNYNDDIKEALYEELIFDYKDENAFSALNFYTKLFGYNNVSLKYNGSIILEVK